MQITITVAFCKIEDKSTQVLIYNCTVLKHCIIKSNFSELSTLHVLADGISHLLVHKNFAHLYITVDGCNMKGTTAIQIGSINCFWTH